MKVSGFVGELTLVMSKSLHRYSWICVFVADDALAWLRQTWEALAASFIFGVWINASGAQGVT